MDGLSVDWLAGLSVCLSVVIISGGSITLLTLISGHLFSVTSFFVVGFRQTRLFFLFEQTVDVWIVDEQKMSIFALFVNTREQFILERQAAENHRLSYDLQQC